MENNFPILYINRDIDIVRREFIEKNLSEIWNGEAVRVPAVDGTALDFDPKNYIIDGVGYPGKTLPAKSQRPTAACFLSHMKAWDYVLKSEHDYALILEDDVEILPELKQLATNLKSVPGFDLVFVNERCISYRSLSEKFTTSPVFAPISDLYQNLAATLELGRFERKMARPEGLIETAPGGDGYVLAKSGAAKLIELFNAYPRLRHVDEFLYSMSIDPKVAKTARQNPVWTRKGVESVPASIPRPTSFIYNEIVVKHSSRKVGGTVRGKPKRENKSRHGTQQKTVESLPQDLRRGNPKVYIHLDFHSTGTSAIQKTLVENANRLGQRFSLYLPKTRTGKKLSDAAVGMHWAHIAGEQTQSFKEELQSLAYDIREKATSGGHQVLISVDNLCGAMAGLRNAYALYPALQDITSSLTSGFSPLEIKFLVTARNDEIWLNDSYIQLVMLHGFNKSFETYSAEFTAAGSLNSTIVALRKNVVAQNVSMIEQEATTTRGFLRSLDISDETIKTLVNVDSNEELPGGNSVELMREINALGLPWPRLKQIRHILERRKDLIRD